MLKGKIYIDKTLEVLIFHNFIIVVKVSKDSSPIWNFDAFIFTIYKYTINWVSTADII